MRTQDDNPRKIEPELLGPLADRPLAESAPTHSTNDLFSGSSAFLRGRHAERRRAQWSAVRSLIDRLVGPDERVLYVAHAMQNPTVFQHLSLGYMAYIYHQVLLVMTDSRMFEILLNVKGTAPETRIRSYPWKHVSDVRLRLGTLQITPAKGKKQGWKLRVPGDRKILKLLLPRIKERLLHGGRAAAVDLPAWHCPECGRESPARPERCLSCGAVFRSPRLAALLSVAFPGAGLLYAGHPILATMDFLGEVLLFALFAVALATASGTAQVVGLVAMGAIFLVMTKLESVHVGHVLVTRTRPESGERYAGFRRFAMLGGLVSLLALTSAVLASGTFKPVLDHDLAVTSTADTWTGSTNRAEWKVFADDPSARAQWTHESGVTLTLFAYQLGSASERAQFKADFTASMAGKGRLLLADDRVSDRFQGFRHVSEVSGEDGEPIASLNYFVYDTEGSDIHQIFAAVPSSMQEAAMQVVEDFLAHAEWTEAATSAP